MTDRGFQEARSDVQPSDYLFEPVGMASQSIQTQRESGGQFGMAKGRVLKEGLEGRHTPTSPLDLVVKVMQAERRFHRPDTIVSLDRLPQHIGGASSERVGRQSSIARCRGQQDRRTGPNPFHLLEKRQAVQLRHPVIADDRAIA